MKKSFIAKLVATALSFTSLVACSNGDNPGPTPEEDVKFSATSTVTLDKAKTKADIILDWMPTEHSIECSDFTFTLANQTGITSKITAGELGSRPLNLTITFTSPLMSEDKGDLKFHYNDKTAKKEGEGKVTGINVKLPEDPPVDKSWTLKLDDASKNYGDLQFKDQTADSVTIDEYIGVKDAILMTFIPASGYDKTQFTLTAQDAKKGTVTVDSYAPGTPYATFNIKKEEGFADGDEITLHFEEPAPITYSISMATGGTTITPTTLPTDQDYKGTINVTAKNKILDGLTSVILKDGSKGTDITSQCGYTPETDNKSASLEIPLKHLTNDIEVTVALTDEPVTGTWTLKLDDASKNYGDLQFKDQTADSVTIDEYIGVKVAITMTFIPASGYDKTKFTITAQDAKGGTVTVDSYIPGTPYATFNIKKDEGFADGDEITLHFEEPAPPVTTYSIYTEVEGVTIEPDTFEPAKEENYAGVIKINNKSNSTLPAALTSVKLNDGKGDDIKGKCTYTLKTGNKEADFIVPLTDFTSNIKVDLELVSENYVIKFNGTNCVMKDGDGNPITSTGVEVEEGLTDFYFEGSSEEYLLPTRSQVSVAFTSSENEAPDWTYSPSSEKLV